jgi:hypothetical protein
MAYGSNRSRYSHLRDNNGSPHPSGGSMCNGSCCGSVATHPPLRFRLSDWRLPPRYCLLGSITGIGACILQVRCMPPAARVLRRSHARNQDDEPQRRALTIPVRRAVSRAACCSNHRRVSSIKGGCCGDCCVSCWCHSCELTQEHLELEEEEKMNQGRR